MEMEGCHGTAVPPELARFLHWNGRRCGVKTTRTTRPGLVRDVRPCGVCTFPNRNGHAVLHCLEFEEASMEGGTRLPVPGR